MRFDSVQGAGFLVFVQQSKFVFRAVLDMVGIFFRRRRRRDAWGCGSFYEGLFVNERFLLSAFVLF